MPKKSNQKLTDKFKSHSKKSLAHFAEADEIYNQMQTLPRGSEHDKLLEKMLNKDSDAITEALKASELTKEFVNNQDGYLNKVQKPKTGRPKKK